MWATVFCAAMLSIGLALNAEAASLLACDKNHDQRVTVVDALLALREAVTPQCVGYDPCPDMNGDGEMTATDALMLLRVAVGLDADADCSCFFMDECFEDADCYGYPEGWYCAGYSCVECEFGNQCASGVCDRCAGVCQPVTTTTKLPLFAD